jgi:hypothetical protein
MKYQKLLDTCGNIKATNVEKRECDETSIVRKIFLLKA